MGLLYTFLILLFSNPVLSSMGISSNLHPSYLRVWPRVYTYKSNKPSYLVFLAISDSFCAKNLITDRLLLTPETTKWQPVDISASPEL